MKFLKNLPASINLSGHQYGFRKESSTKDFLSFLPDSWSSSLNYFSVTYLPYVNSCRVCSATDSATTMLCVYRIMGRQIAACLLMRKQTSRFRKTVPAPYISRLSSESYTSVYGGALDISNAFDRVRHKPLLSKLSNFRFYPSLCTLISCCLSDHSVSVVVDGHCFTPQTINSAVPQNCVLSPTLFLLFINDPS